MSRRTSIVTAVVAIVVVVALLAVVLSRWNGAVGRSATVGVPVMWVSLGDDGAMNGGVSTVGVTVNQTGSADAYSVDLNVSTSGSTGKTWDASAASAAAVAMLYSAQDPRGVQVAFKVDDAINGSSAGGALTVGVLAALRGTNLKSGVTMTGTISPDGSIGSVDGVEAKVRGAAAAGYTRVMVPTASTTSAQPTKPTASASGTASATPTASATGTAPSTSGSSETSAVDVAVLSSELGIEVWAVSTVGEAYQGFTGRDVAAPAASAPALAAGFGGLVDAQVTSAQTALDADLAVAIKAGTVTAAQGSAARAQLAASREQAAKGERANAYATAIAVA